MLQPFAIEIPMTEEDTKNTAFITLNGLFEFNVIPFDLTNVPATFERMIDTVLHDIRWTTCLRYLNDIIVFSTSL